MDAKFFSTKSLGISGLMLFWVLAISLSLTAIALDTELEHAFTLGSCLTVPFLLAALASSARSGRVR